MRLRVDSEATLQFTGNYNKTITMTVEARSQPSLGKCAVTFVSDHNLKDIIDLRQLTADLLVSRTSGIRIPKEAMREAVRETEKEDGETETANVNCIYIISGVQAEQVDVNILAEYDDFYLVEPTTRLRDGTEVITEANDLYDGKVVR
jgi:predicted nucleotidyltransferase